MRRMSASKSAGVRVIVACGSPMVSSADTVQSSGEMPPRVCLLHYSTSKVSLPACKLPEQCVLHSRGAPPVSCYAFFEGWLLLSRPPGFIAPLSLHARRPGQGGTAAAFLSYRRV